MLTIEMLPAGHGDCLWIEYGTGSYRRRLLIDGGTKPTYAFLKTRLQALKVKLKRTPRFEAVIVTHVDADHIEGILELLTDRGLDVEIGDIWFNGWKHLAQKDELGPVQGEKLSALIRERNLPWNQAFRGGAVVSTEKGPLPTCTLTGGLNLTVLSPLPAQLKKLRGVWKKVLQKAGLDPDVPVSAKKALTRTGPADVLGTRLPDVKKLADTPFHADTSVANGSSIALLLEWDGRRCLLAADAFADVMMHTLPRILAKPKSKPLSLDAFKLSHHGSRNNTSVELLRHVACRRFLISTNGDKYNHPDQETIAQVIVHGGRSVSFHFNYRSADSLIWNRDGLKNAHRYEASYPERDCGAQVQF